MSSSNGNDTKHPLSDEQLADFEKMLPWLVNDTLSAEEKSELESALEQSEKLRQEKELLELLQQQVQQQEMPDAPVEFAWQKMKRQIAEEKKQAPQIVQKSKENKWRYVAMAASVLLVIQSSSLFVSWNQDDPYRPLTSGSESAKQNAVQLSMQFVDTATAVEIQQILRQYQLSIISGPSSIGLYKITGPENSNDNAEKLLNQLKSRTDVIAHVQQNE